MKLRTPIWYFWYATLFGISVVNVSAQQPASEVVPHARAAVPGSSTSTNGPGPASDADSQLQPGNLAGSASIISIGPGDELDISVFGLPELSEHVRVSSSGDVSLPLVGDVHLAELSSEEAEVLLEQLLTRGHFVNNPHVSVYVKEYTSEGITLIGEVNRPGVYPVLGAHRLLDLVQTAGGFTEKAGSKVTVSHRDDANQPVTLTLSNDTAKMAEDNIELLPGDTIVVSKAGIVYVLGEVTRPGGFVIEDHTITASQVLAMAFGPTHLASLKGSRIIRRTSGGLKEMPLSLQKIMQAKIPDVTLQADDIIFVPESKVKGAFGPLNIGSMILGAAIYRL